MSPSRLQYCLLPAATLALLGCLLAPISVSAQDQEHRGPILVEPANGAVLDRQITVRIGFAGRGPRGPAEGTGIAPENSPNDRPRFERGPGADETPPGPGEDTGLNQRNERRRGPHFALSIDAPIPEPGSPFTADDRHIAFPAGIPQMTITLPPGEHRLLLLLLDREGAISPRFHATEMTKVLVR